MGYILCPSCGIFFALAEAVNLPKKAVNLPNNFLLFSDAFIMEEKYH